ncbi:uncharacterized protein LOC135138515 [Zophobas morio]|uniref:uncharacterized protein LOC135138515 n=1 Tax=Zophobas morio TaxID=2755281 RepID=UPI0030839B61
MRWLLQKKKKTNKAIKIPEMTKTLGDAPRRLFPPRVKLWDGAIHPVPYSKNQAETIQKTDLQTARLKHSSEPLQAQNHRDSLATGGVKSSGRTLHQSCPSLPPCPTQPPMHEMTKQKKTSKQNVIRSENANKNRNSYCEFSIRNTISNSDDVKTFQRNLDTLVDWCNKSELLLNADKCYVMTFSRKVNVVKSDYTINGRILCKKNEVKDLGVLFDSRLSFVEHISNISTSASKMLGFIFRVSKTFQDPLLLKSLYFAYVVSKMEYASVVWYPYYVIHNLAVEKVQRRFLKYLSYKIDGFYPQRNIDYNYLLQKHGFVSLKNRREEHSARFISRLISGKIDCPELLERVNFHVPRVASRYMATFHQPISRTNLLRKAPIVPIPKKDGSQRKRQEVSEGSLEGYRGRGYYRRRGNRNKEAGRGEEMAGVQRGIYPGIDKVTRAGKETEAGENT